MKTVWLIWHNDDPAEDRWDVIAVADSKAIAEKAADNIATRQNQPRDEYIVSEMGVLDAGAVEAG